LAIVMPATVYGRKRRSEIAGSLSQWREEAGWGEKLAAAGLFAVLTALAAQLKLFLPFTPVPLTGQVFVVLLAGFVLGRYGAVSMGMYLVAGAAFGWFSGAVGAAAFTGVTAGYLAGFVVSAALIGEMAQRHRNWSLRGIAVLMLAGDMIILLLGSLWLAALLHIDLSSALMLGAVPFLVVDALKIGAASSVGYLLAVHPSKES
jgi:biotin transport system substrate-specific component